MSSLAGESIGLHVKCLRTVGFLRACSSNSGLVIAVHEVYRLITLAATSMYLMQELIYAYQEHKDMDKLARVMFLLLCHVTSLAKQIVLHTDADRIEKMIKDLNDPIFNPSDVFSRNELLMMSKSSRRLVTVYAGTAWMTCTLWLVFPVIQHARGMRVEFALWTNLDYNETRIFVWVLLYTYLITSLIGIANTTMDAFMGTILYQNKTQISILRNNLKNLAAIADEESVRINEPRSAILMRLFLQCLTHYRKVVESTTLLQNIFGRAILIQFTIGAWILCMAAYKIVSLNLLSIEFASMVLFTICILTELFLYCYYGNEVSVESDMLVTSMYQVRWTDADIQFRKALILAMERAKRPLKLTAGGVVPLSLNTFIQIIKSSYTFYTVLRQTK